MGVFLPCYLFVVIPAPTSDASPEPEGQSLRRWRHGRRHRAIAGAAFVLGRRALVDLPAVAIALGAWLVLSKRKKVPEPLVIAAAAVIRLLLRRS